LTLALFAMGYARNCENGIINRLEGSLLVAVYTGYTVYLINSVVS
jgi:cation:H+ antiporter